MKKISNLRLKVQLTNEYLRTGGVEQIFDLLLLRELQLVRIDPDGEPILETISPAVNAFMLGILASHKSPPFLHKENISEYQSFLKRVFSLIRLILRLKRKSTSCLPNTKVVRIFYLEANVKLNGFCIALCNAFGFGTNL